MKTFFFLKHLFFLSSIMLILLSTSCKPEKTDPKNDSEVITTLECQFTDSATGLLINTFRFADPDGDGGMDPTTDDQIQLATNKTYFVAIRFLDETKNPVVDITQEIEEEGEEHQVFYELAANTGIQILYDDIDTQGNPLGLQTKWKTTSAASGTVRVILKHQPGVKDGSPLSGETDFDHTFSIQIN